MASEGVLKVSGELRYYKVASASCFRSALSPSWRQSSGASPADDARDRVTRR